MENYEQLHREEYFQAINQSLSDLLKAIETADLQESDFRMLSGRATEEVSAYIRDCLIKPLGETQSISISESTTGKEPSKLKLNSVQRVLSVSAPLQELFASLKEVPHLDPIHYEQIVSHNPNVVSTLENFINKLEAARRGRAKT